MRVYVWICVYVFKCACVNAVLKSPYTYMRMGTFTDIYIYEEVETPKDKCVILRGFIILLF